MSLVKPVVYNGQLQQQLQPGDLLVEARSIPATIATTAITITAAQLLQQYILRSEAANATDTLDSAANLVAGFNAGLGTNGIQPGSTWIVTWINNAAFTITVAATANTGVTVTRGAIAATSSKSFLFTVVNGSPAQSFVASIVNATPTLTGLTAPQLAALSVGMVITNSVVGLQGLTILGVNLTAGTVTLSGNASSDGVNVTVNFSPVVKIEGLAP